MNSLCLPMLVEGFNASDSEFNRLKKNEDEETGLGKPCRDSD